MTGVLVDDEDEVEGCVELDLMSVGWDDIVGTEIARVGESIRSRGKWRGSRKG